MDLRDIRKRHEQEASKVGTQFWSPKVKDSLVGKISGLKEINDHERFVFYNVPTGQFFILPSHGHLDKQLEGASVGEYYYIELSAESVLKTGPGKGKIGKLYYVSKLTDEEIAGLNSSEGVEEPIVGAVQEEPVEDKVTEDKVPF